MHLKNQRRLAKNVLEKVKEICYQVKDEIKFDVARRGLGYRITIPLTKAKDIVIRIMYQAGQRVNSYYRIAVSGKEKYAKSGLPIESASESHIDMSSESLRDIVNIISKIWSEKWKK